MIPAWRWACLWPCRWPILLTKSPLAERLISPYLIASQAIPIIAIAPLLSIGPVVVIGRVLVAALVVFFPILVNSIAGFRAVPREFYDLMHSLRATKSQIFRKLERRRCSRAGRPQGGATLAVIGALVVEFVQPVPGPRLSAFHGSLLQFRPMRFVVLLTLGAMALSL